MIPLKNVMQERPVGSGKTLLELNKNNWLQMQAETQFQGPGSSHEMASLCITEAINISLNVNKEPVFVLCLDAQSAFDRILIPHVCRSLFLAGTTAECILYLEQRLQNRKTYIEWDKEVVGPISDNRGLEQGGTPSDRLYRLSNNEQLQIAQESGLGICLSRFFKDNHKLLSTVTLSAIGQADDVCHISSSILNLKCLLELTKEFCAKFHVKLVGEKTKLLVFSNKYLAFSAVRFFGADFGDTFHTSLSSLL